MKAICIVGSPNKKGTTATVVDKVREGFKRVGIEVQVFVLGDYLIQYCRGCKKCYISRKCVIRDDMDMLLDQLLLADIVVVASPSYWGDVSGQLKVFFDRCTPLCDTNGGMIVPEGKLGVSVAVRTGTRVEENMRLVASIEHFFGHLGIKPTARITVQGASYPHDFEMQEDKVQEALEVGKNIIMVS